MFTFMSIQHNWLSLRTFACRRHIYTMMGIIVTFTYAIYMKVGNYHFTTFIILICPMFNKEQKMLLTSLLYHYKLIALHFQQINNRYCIKWMNLFLSIWIFKQLILCKNVKLDVMKNYWSKYWHSLLCLWIRREVCKRLKIANIWTMYLVPF